MYSRLRERLEQGQVVIMDGGMGTELEKRGVPMNMAAWSAMAMETHPDVVRQTHKDYIDAGADVIIANTFPAIRQSLERAGLGDRVAEVNTRAVTLAREARESADRDVFIAGSISTYSPDRDPTLDLSPQRTASDYREQAQILGDAGVDFIVLEMMKDVAQSALAIDAALSTGLPIWVGFSCQVERGDGKVILLRRPDISFRQAIDTLTARRELQGCVMSVMHTNVDTTTQALKVLKQGWQGPAGAYPNSGWFKRPHWQFENIISPRDFANEAAAWVNMGVQVIGGCCGLGPDHVRALRETLPSHIPTDA